MSLLYFRGGPRDGEVLDFKDTEDLEVLSTIFSDPMYFISKSSKCGFYHADFGYNLHRFLVDTTPRKPTLG
jgi:hypothetical protein